MMDVIAVVLSTTAWLGGVFVLLMMALVPLLERLGTPGRRR
jgi:hypothetical protein